MTKFSRGKDPKRHIPGGRTATITAGFKLSKSKEKINHLMYMDDIKLFAKNEELATLIQTVRIYRQYIRMELRNRKMRHANNEKWQSTHNGRS